MKEIDLEKYSIERLAAKSEVARLESDPIVKDYLAAQRTESMYPWPPDGYMACSGEHADGSDCSTVAPEKTAGWVEGVTSCGCGSEQMYCPEHSAQARQDDPGQCYYCSR